LAVVLWSGFVPEVSLLLVLLLPVLPLIEPALELCCESGFCPLFGFCLSMESEEPVCGVVAEGVCVSCDVVDDVLC
jgi:hypothetical protein